MHCQGGAVGFWKRPEPADWRDLAIAAVLTTGIVLVGWLLAPH
jgi:hypothetical protein